eukprot:ctg_6338.g652
MRGGQTGRAVAIALHGGKVDVVLLDDGRIQGAEVQLQNAMGVQAAHRLQHETAL